VRRRELGALIVGLAAMALGAACGRRTPKPVKTNETLPRKIRVFVVAQGEVTHDPRSTTEVPAGVVLAQSGQLRALGLPGKLPLEDIDQVIADRDDDATRATLEPLTALLGLDPVPPAEGAKALAEQLREHNLQTVLVVVPRARIGPLLDALGVPDSTLQALEPDDFDELFEVRITPDGTKARHRSLR
jgi:hypothetical protein